MSSRFEDAPDQVVELMNKIRQGNFPELRSAKIKVLFDTKKRKSGGKLVLGRMQKTNDLLRHLTIDESGDEEGYDYILYIDKACFENIDEIDQVRIIRHELCHCDVDIESNNSPYKIKDHQISDFYSEIDFNSVDPRWAERCAAVAESVYEAE
jgi:hypothetical protein